MTKEHEVWIIGTVPPCPRCDYLARMVQDVIGELELRIPVRHMSYTDQEACSYAASLGLEPGTAKDVARKASIDIDWGRVNALADGDGPKDASPQEGTCCPTAAALWSPISDELLRPCEIKARDVGILMTPVLVVDGRCVHQGSVPDRKHVVKWIQSAFGGVTRGERCGHIMEVLGPGCAKCEELYRNAVEAVNLVGLADCIEVRKRTDIGYFLEMGVTVTPGLVIDGTVVSKGRVLKLDQIADRLRNDFHEDCPSQRSLQIIQYELCA